MNRLRRSPVPAPRSGVTLPELLVALVLMAIILTALAQTLITSLAAVGDAERRLRATAIHNEALDAFQAADWAQVGIDGDLEDEAWKDTFDDPSGTVEAAGGFDAVETISAGGDTFTLKRHIEGVDGDSLRRLTTVVLWDGPGDQRRETRASAYRAAPESE